MVGNLHINKAYRLKKVNVFTADIFIQGRFKILNQQSLFYLAVGVRPSSCQNFEIVPFRIMTS